MTRISALSAEQSPEASKPILAAIQSGFGITLNVFKTMAHSPAVLVAYTRFYEAMESSTLSTQEQETIALAVSAVNDCNYCMSVHTMMARKGGMSIDAIRAARTGELDAFAKFAYQVAATRGKVSDADLDAARKAGLSDTQLIETIGQVALLTFSNLLNNVAHTELDVPAAER